MVKAIKELYWQKSLDKSQEAIKCGKLIPIETTLEYLNTDIILNFEKRDIKKRSLIFSSYIGPSTNPFSPWDKDLEIDYINNNHVLILNKYPVQIGHMLLISKEWKPQNGWLDISDWSAYKTVDKDTTGLWFFNSCKEAGASQTLRHMQLLRRVNSDNI